MGELWNSIYIDWQALSAVGTLAAVLVALLPIWRETLRNRAKARSLRFRLCSKLTVLRPSLIAAGTQSTPNTPAALLSQDDFRQAVSSIGTMMQESSALNAAEQDQLGILLANLEVAALLYGTDDLHTESANNTLTLLDSAVAILFKHGLLTGEVIKPWRKTSR